MTIATAVAMIVGVVVVLAAIAIQWPKREITGPGIIMTVVGFILITSPNWTSILVDVGGQKIELKQFADATTAADDVAGQVEVLAGEVAAIKTQLIGLSSMLQTGQPVSPAAARQIESRLSNLPVVDRSKLSSARSTLNRVRTGLERTPRQ
jgi:hypothetical protein